MKNNAIMKRHIFAIILLALAAGCRETDTEPAFAGQGPAVRFAAPGAVASRAIVGADGTQLDVAWSSGDAIGIFGRGAVSGDNYPYAAAPDRNEPAQCSFSPMTLDRIFEWRPGRQEFYACYPYDGTLRSEPNAWPVSLPAQQVQSAVGSTEHLAALCTMKAEPVSRVFDESDDSPVEFTFHNLFAMVEIRLKMDAGSSIDVPIRQIRLVSEESALTIPAGTVDLTAPIGSGYTVLPVEALEESREAVLTFGQQLSVSRSDYGSFWLMVAPGHHAAGNLKLYVTAIDNSVCTVELPEADFKSNRNYRRDVELNLDDFEAANPFGVSAEAVECRVGEPIRFALEGAAESVDFFSGEMYHQWEYADKDRLSYSDILFSFRSQLQGGVQVHPVTVKVSTDFDGTYTEDRIKAATWTDVTARFTLPTKIWTANNGPTTADRYAEKDRMTDSGEVDLTSYYGDSETLHVAFFYHIDKYDAGLKNTRTGVWFTDIQAFSREGETRTGILRQVESDIHIVNGASYTDTTLSGWGATFAYGGETIYPWRFWCANNPTGDRDAYAVMSPLQRTMRNFGPDRPERVKISGGEMPGTFDYVFAEPGVYETTFVARIRTLSGETEIVRHFTVTVNP